MSEKRTRVNKDDSDSDESNQGERPKFSAEKSRNKKALGLQTKLVMQPCYSKNKKAMDSQTAKACQSPKTAVEMRNQTKLVMQPYANWEEYLTPALLSIAILGELVFISSETDFSINKNPPKGFYKHISDPNSFHACLMQVCNSGWWAFNEARKNMDQIRLHTIKLPDYMKTAAKILFQDNCEIVQALLPLKLGSICTIADDCLEMAELTESQFSDVIRFIHELLEACAHALHVSREELEAVKKKLEEMKIRKVSLENAIRECRARGSLTGGMYEKSEENMQRNQRQLEEILITMKNCEIRETDFNTTIQILVKGMDAMGRVKEQWEKMMKIFHIMSSIMKSNLRPTLKAFTATSENIQSLSYKSKLFAKDMLYDQTFQAIDIASFVHMISTTYTEVSNNHLVDHFSSLGKLMTMDKTKPESEHERLKFQNSCYEAQEGISRHILQNKAEFEKKMKSIQAAVESGFTEEDLALFY
ncbi:hypothetical protein AOLI_G00318900 [Acnodon oligacanthus]